MTNEEIFVATQRFPRNVNISPAISYYEKLRNMGIKIAFIIQTQ